MSKKLDNTHPINTGADERSRHIGRHVSFVTCCLARRRLAGIRLSKSREAGGVTRNQMPPIASQCLMHS